VQAKNLAIDAAVRIVVKIFGPHDERDFVANFREQEQASENGPLCLGAPRRLPIEQLPDVGICCTARFAVYRGHVGRSITT
jgi:hypothetical protein